DIAETRRTVGRALFLCAATTVTGFGSNIWSSNGGLASLGQGCAAGIAFAYFTSTFLLPVWWKTLLRHPTFDSHISPDAAAAQSARRGILLLTPHLGNWEFGAPLLARRGVNLLVITLAEPTRRLTELRQASRARWGIETLVIGRDPFAFVEIIRRLESGAVVALLVDRPPETSAVMVELFGRKFAASIAAAELARASGC